jgi:peptidoglycan hydrolase CwlO-like protein
MPQKLTPEIIIAAIAGFEAQKNHIDSQIAELRSMLDGGSKELSTTTEFAKPRKKRSAAVRRKMALAQRARFAKLKQSAEPSQAESAKPKKRKLSAAGRKNIIEATKRRWAAIRAAKEAGKPAVAKTASRKKGAA